MAEDKTDQLINVQLQQLAAQVANWAAQLDFAKERFRLLELPEFQSRSQLEIDRLAFEKAQATWENAYKEASLSGTYNGQPTIEWLTQQAQLTGVLNGQQTLQGKLTDAQISQMNEQMRLANEQFLVQTTGYHQGRPTFEREQWTTGQTGYLDGQSTLARQQMEANLSGYFNGRSTLAREQFQGEQTQNYLQLLSSLQSNPFRQLRVLNQTPEGLRSLVNAWAGTYNMPGFGSSGAPGQTQMNELWDPQNFGSAAAPVPPNTGPPGMPGQWGSGGPGASSGVPGGAPFGATAQGYGGSGGLPAAPTMNIPVYTGPQGPVPPAAGEAIPGRGFTPDQWNDATRAAVAAWNVAHPGFLADGSQQGFMTDPSFNPSTGTAPAPMNDPYTRWLNSAPAFAAPGSDPYQVWRTQNEYAERWNTMTPEARRAWYVAQAGVTPEMAAAARFDLTIPPQADPGAAGLPVPTEAGYAQYAALFGGAAATPERIYEWSQLPAQVKAYYASQPMPAPVSPSPGVWSDPSTPPPPSGPAPIEVLPQDPGYAAAQAATNNVTVPGYTYSPEGTVAPPGAYNYSATEQGHTQVYPPGVTAPPDQAQVSTQTPVNNSTANSLLATSMPGTGGSLSPSQINAYNYNRTNPALQNLMWQYFENEGWDPVAAKGEFMASLPRYAGPTEGRVQI